MTSSKGAAAFGPLRSFVVDRQLPCVGAPRSSPNPFRAPPVTVRACALAPHGVRAWSRQRRVRPGRSASLVRSVLRPTALRCSVLRPRRGTRCVRCALYAQTAATRVLTSRAAREAASPALLGAPEGAPPAAPTRLCSQASGVLAVGARTTEHQRPSLAAGGTRRGRFLGRRGTQPRGRRAQRASLSFWPRLSERRERSERSEFRGPTPGRVPQGSRRVQRRPPQHEPPPGTAWREARQREVVGGRGLTSATGRKQTTKQPARFMHRRGQGRKAQQTASRSLPWRRSRRDGISWWFSYHAFVE